MVTKLFLLQFVIFKQYFVKLHKMIFAVNILRLKPILFIFSRLVLKISKFSDKIILKPSLYPFLILFFRLLLSTNLIIKSLTSLGLGIS